MRVDLTVAGPAGEHDVTVSAPDTAELADVLPGLAAVVGASESAGLWLGNHPLPQRGALAASGLRPGSVVTVGRPHPPEPAGVLALQVVGGPAAGHSVPLERGRVRIGREPGCEIVLPDVDVSRQHAVVDVSPSGITLHDLGSTNGTRLDGLVVPPGGATLRPGALIGIGDSFLTLRGPEDAPASVRPGTDGTLSVLRPPRHRPSVARDEVVLPARPTPPRPHGVQWLAALLPAAAGGLLAWLSGSPQFLLFVLLSPLMMLGTALGDRLHWRRSRRRDAASFRRRQAAAQRRIADGLAAETASRRAANPDPAWILRQASLPGCRLWERRLEDADLLQVRLGTTDLPSRLAARDGAVAAPAGLVRAVPLSVDLRAGPLGVAAPGDVVTGVGRWIIGQLAVLHSPADVELAVLLDENSAPEWAWLRWLPHLRNNVAVATDEWPQLVARLTTVVEQRLVGRRGAPGGWPGPWIVVLVARASRLSEVPGLAALLDRGRHAGLTALCLDGEVGNLPSGCTAVLRTSGETGTRLALRTSAGEPELEAVADRVSAEWAARLARSLAALRDAGAGGAGAIPDACGLLDALQLAGPDPAEIAQRWSRSAGTARAVIGRSADGPLTVDLVADGPHALVAGTTGAGKSELLQTLVTALAADQSPDELNVLLIDYKGGAAFADCARLPHTAGLVTDLDPYLTERALRSLHSELRRREALFAGAGVSELGEYRTSHPPEPLPRLVIVVDEFAALAEELPEFVRGLVGVAQRGRSLGVHLVLATQRPGTAVSAEIRANTALRIALRVTDAAESADVIDAPDAASLDGGSAGRGYLRTGQTLTAFQAAHAAHVAPADPRAVVIDVLGQWRRRRAADDPPAGPTDLARLTTAIIEAAAQAGHSRASSPWLAPLPEVLEPAALPVCEPPTRVPVGLVDLPDEQRHEICAVDLGGAASVLGAGTAGSGRTGFLLSLATSAANRLAPGALHLHVLDSAGRLAAGVRPLPHCATVLGPDDTAVALRLLRRLERECGRRLAGAVTGPPRLLLLVDGWDVLTAALPDVEAIGCVDTLTNLLRIGPAAGLTVAVTGDRTTLIPRFAASFTHRLVFRLADRADYPMTGIDARAVPNSLPRGRALRAGDGAAVQIAEPIDAAAIAAKWATAPPLGADAVRIRPLPARVRLADVPGTDGDRRLIIGVADDEPVPLSVDPFTGAGRILVAGPPRSGRTTALRSFAEQAAAAGIRAVVAAPQRSALVETARRCALPIVLPSDPEAGSPPTEPTLLLVDDSETFTDNPVGDQLVGWLRSARAPIAAVVAGRSDDLATSFRGIGAEVRRAQCGILLRPGPVDGELLGARLPRRPAGGPPGRGVAVGEPAWGAAFEDGEPVPVQVATP